LVPQRQFSIIGWTGGPDKHFPLKNDAPHWGIYDCLPDSGEAMFARSLRLTMIAPVTVALLAIGAPSITTLAWHLTHRNVQQYENYEISVPNQFILLRSAGAVKLVHARPVASSKFYQLEMIEIEQKVGNIDVSSWTEKVVRELTAQGSPDVHSFFISVAGFPAGCVERGQGSATVILCRTSNSLVIQYFGDMRGAESVRRVVSGITKR